MSDLVHNERTKLTATFLNIVASGLLITAVVAPGVAAFYGVQGPAQATASLITLSGFARLAAIITIHLAA